MAALSVSTSACLDVLMILMVTTVAKPFQQFSTKQSIDSSSRVFVQNFFYSPSTTPLYIYTIYCTAVRFWNPPVQNPSCFLLFGPHLCVSILPFSHLWHTELKKLLIRTIWAPLYQLGRIPNKPQIGNVFLWILGDATKIFAIAIPGRNSQSIYLWIKKNQRALGHLTSRRCSRSIEDDHD